MPQSAFRNLVDTQYPTPNLDARGNRVKGTHLVAKAYLTYEEVLKQIEMNFCDEEANTLIAYVSVMKLPTRIQQIIKAEKAELRAKKKAAAYAKAHPFPTREEIMKAIEIDPAFELAYFARGNAYNFSRKYDQAIADFTKCIEIYPQDVLYYNNRGTAYSSKGASDLALADYNKAIEIDPSYAHTYRNRGGIYYNAHKLDPAISDYNMAIKLDPSFADAYNDRGTAYTEKGNGDQAIMDYTKAIELDPQYALAYINRAQLYYLKLDFNKAWADVHKSEELGYDIRQDAKFIDMLKKASGRQK